MNRIYISGKISGMEYEEASILFNTAEQYVIDTYKCEVVNPINQKEDSWEAYMAVDIPLLLECDGIYILDNWKESKGARIEVAIAKEFELKLIFQ